MIPNQELKYTIFEGVKTRRGNKYDLSITNKRCIFIHMSGPLTYLGILCSLFMALNVFTILLFGILIFGGIIPFIIVVAITSPIVKYIEQGRRNKLTGQSLNLVLPLNKKNFTIDISEIIQAQTGKNGKSFTIKTIHNNYKIEVTTKDSSKIESLYTIPNFKEKLL